MNSATKSRYTRIWTWLIWTLVVLVMLTAPPALMQDEDAGRAVAVTLQSEAPEALYPWRSRSRWKKWAWRRYQRWRRRRQQALWRARRARLYLLGVQSVAGLFDVLLERQLRYQVGSLPIMYALLEQLQVRRIINKHVSSRAQVDIGAVALVLTLNRLQAPRPLYRIADWMGSTVLAHLIGVDAARFNDDRLARALDAIAPHIEPIREDVLAEAVRLGDVELTAIFYDLTAYVLHGRYAESDLVDFGFAHNTPSNKRKVKLGLNVLAGSWLPGPFQIWSGRTADQATVAVNIDKLKRWLHRTFPKHVPPLIVGDRAMLNDALAFDYVDAQLDFLSGLPGHKKEVKRLLAQGDEGQFRKLPLESGSAPQYWGRPCTVTLQHKGRRMKVKGLVVLSEPMRQQWRATRQKQMATLEGELQALQARIGEPRLRTPRIVTRRAQACLRRSPVGKFYRIHVREVAGHVLLHRERDEEALARQERLDGRYLLVTNRWRLTYQEMFQLYRDKDGVEKAFRISKQELRVAPLHLHKDRRIQAMLLLNMIALLAYRLLAHQLRQQGLSASLHYIRRTLEELTLVESHFLDGSVLRRLTPLSSEGQRLWSLAHQAVAALQMPFIQQERPLPMLPLDDSPPPTAISPPPS